jgi:anti-sigma factor RsiW
MECAELRSRLPEVLSGTSVSGIEEHLLRCEACRREVAEVRRVLDLVRSATASVAAVEPPPFDEVLARVRSRPRIARRWLARAAALLLAALLGAAGDRALTRSSAHPVPDERALAAREEARRAISERPGGLGSSLAVLKALSLDRKRR